MPHYDQRAAIEKLFNDFPRVRDEVENSMAGLLRMEMGCFARYVQRQIDTDNRGELNRCYDYLLGLLQHGDKEVQEAARTSVLEHLDVRDRQWALDAMPPELKKLYG